MYKMNEVKKKKENESKKKMELCPFCGLEYGPPSVGFGKPRRSCGCDGGAGE